MDAIPTSRQSPSQPRPLAMPGHIPRDADRAIVWWTPSWSDVARRMRWRWFYFTPLIGIIAMIGAAFAFPFLFQLLIVWMKLWLLIGGLGVAAAAKAVKEVVRDRPEPFCIH